MRNWMLKQPLGFTGCSSIQFFSSLLAPVTHPVRPHLVASHSLCSPCVTYRTPSQAVGHQLLPTLSLVKEASILTMRLCSYSQFNSHQIVLPSCFHLCVRDWYRIFYQPLASFELTILLIVLFILRRFFKAFPWTIQPSSNICFTTIFRW